MISLLFSIFINPIVQVIPDWDTKMAKIQDLTQGTKANLFLHQKTTNMSKTTSTDSCPIIKSCGTIALILSIKSIFIETSTVLFV